MSGLVNKVLEMAGLESGTVMLNRDWQNLEELVGAALTELDGQLMGQDFRLEKKSGCSTSSTARAQRAGP
jgi:two-component system, OmpR family, sensor histidine kinase KdpD